MACMRHVYGIDEADIDEADMMLAQSKFGYNNVWHKLIIYSVTAGVIFMRNRLEYMFSSLYFPHVCLHISPSCVLGTFLIVPQCHTTEHKGTVSRTFLGNLFFF